MSKTRKHTATRDARNNRKASAKKCYEILDIRCAELLELWNEAS